ncbi:DUF1302 domain-containing protein [Frateuria aurantia]
MATTRPFLPARTALCSALLASVAVPAYAVDFKLDNGEIKGVWKSRVVAGTGIRTSARSPHLVGKGFNSEGKPKGGDGADTADDGNLNYGKGDVFSSLFKVVSSLDMSYHQFGIDLSARTWYDATQKDHEVPQGNSANGFAGDEPLSDRGFDRSNKFSGFMLLNAYLYGHFNTGADSGLDLRLGRQTVRWGEDMFVQNLNQINPIDYTTLHRPGTDPSTEAQLPVEMLWGKWSANDDFSVEMFYQWKWRPSEYDPCGTMFSTTDLGIDQSCSGIQSNAYYALNAYSKGVGTWLSDGYMNSVGAILPGGSTIQGRNSGQWGVASHYTWEAANTTFGGYYMNINSRSPILDATTENPATQNNSLVAKLEAAGVPAADAALSAKLSSITEFWEFPNDIHIAGLSAVTVVDNWRIAGEASYTSNLPVQINTADMFAALTRDGGPIGDRMADLSPGAILRGYDRFDKTQVQFNFKRSFGRILGADSSMAMGELVWSHTNLPPLADARYGRGFAWGYSPQYSDGTCSPVQNPQGCLAKGYFTRQAWAYRLRGQLDYSLPGGWTLSPSLQWGQDMHGYSVDYQLVQGRKLYVLGLAAKHRRYGITVTYSNWVDNAAYDSMKDLDNVMVAFSANF